MEASVVETDPGESPADPAPATPGLEFEPFFAATCQTVVGLVSAVTGDVRLAEDATQEAYLRALRRWNRVRELERPELWVARVASNLAVDRWRRQRRESGVPVDAPVEPPDSLARLWIEWGLAQLTPAERRVVLLKDLEGYPVKEIAGRLERSPETVKSQLASGRRRLRQLLGEDREEDR